MQGCLGVIALATSVQIQCCSDDPRSDPLTPRLHALTFWFSLLLVAAPGLIAILAGAGGMRRTAIAFAVLAVLMSHPALFMYENKFQ